MSFVKQQDFDLIDFLAQSPDLNTIENLWKTLGINVMVRNQMNIKGLWKKLQEEWTKITKEDCQRLIQYYILYIS